jgi:hypothetical protein
MMLEQRRWSIRICRITDPTIGVPGPARWRERDWHPQDAELDTLSGVMATSSSRTHGYLLYASDAGHALIDRELYVPKSWMPEPAPKPYPKPSGELGVTWAERVGR